MRYKTEILYGALSNELISTLSELVDRDVATLPKEHICTVSQGAYYRLSDEVHDILSSNLPLLPNEKISAQLLKHVASTGVHTDSNSEYGVDLATFARTIIIPLKTQQTSTIVFDQYLPDGSPGEETPAFINSLPIINKINQTTIEKYLSFSDSSHQEWMTKLSVEAIFSWVAGDVLMFDRTRLHTGDNHVVTGSGPKEGVIVWTTI